MGRLVADKQTNGWAMFQECVCNLQSQYLDSDIFSFVAAESAQ